VQRDLPLILCGDFNSSATSAVYKLLANNVEYGRLRYVSRCGVCVALRVRSRDELGPHPAGVLQSPSVSSCVAVHGCRRRSTLKAEDMPNDPCNILYSLFRRGKLSHQLVLSSAYSAVTGTSTCRRFNGFIDRVDATES
jgi:hypothetical protein